MKVLAVSLVLIVSSIILTDCARCSSDLETKRSLQRDMLISYYSTVHTFYIVSYSTIKDIGSLNYSVVKNYLLNNRSDQPIDLTKGINKKNETYATFSNGPFQYELNLRPLYVDENQADKNDRCAYNPEVVEYFLASSNHSWSETGVALLNACLLKGVKLANGNIQISVNKTIILLVDGKTNEMNSTELNAIFSKRHNLTFIDYSIFDDKGFCICNNDALHYINNCQSTSRVVDTFVKSLIGPVLFIVTFVIIKAWQCLKLIFR